MKEEKAMYSEAYAIRVAWHKKTSFRDEGGKKPPHAITLENRSQNGYIRVAYNTQSYVRTAISLQGNDHLARERVVLPVRYRNTPFSACL
jgi:hypothetical protein